MPDPNLERSLIANAPAWPNGARCAVALTFDVDTDSMIHYSLPEKAHTKLTALSWTRYDQIAIPRIVEFYRHYGLKQSFCVPSWVAEQYPAMIETIAEGGHEVVLHGHLHELSNELTRDEEASILERGVSIIENVAGARPYGWRAPFYAFSPNTADLPVRRRVHLRLVAHGGRRPVPAPQRIRRSRRDPRRLPIRRLAAVRPERRVRVPHAHPSPPASDGGLPGRGRGRIRLRRPLGLDLASIRLRYASRACSRSVGWSRTCSAAATSGSRRLGKSRPTFGRFPRPANMSRASIRCPSTRGRLPRRQPARPTPRGEESPCRPLKSKSRSTSRPGGARRPAESRSAVSLHRRRGEAVRRLVRVLLGQHPGVPQR